MQYKFFKKLLIFFMFYNSFSIIAQVTFEEKNISLPPKKLVRGAYISQEQGNVRLKNKKDWTIIIYMAADNDLAYFAMRNIMQLTRIGSNKYINIVVHLDIKTKQKKKITLRYFVKRNKLIITNYNDPSSQAMDSGDPETLISCCKWAIQNFPAKHYMLDFWNHGIGCLDSIGFKALRAFDLFNFNQREKKYDLDRSVPFLAYLHAQDYDDDKGICFDDSTRNYLTNKKLQYALETIQKHYLHEKKFDIISFDACLMSMIEIADLIKPYAHIMVGSQEVELGTGYNYTMVLSPFTHNTISKEKLALQIVNTHLKTYQRITNDFTQSAVALTNIDKLTENIHIVASLLIEGLKNQKSNFVTQAIKTSRHKLLCTHFDEPSYIDLHHFYTNLISNLIRFKFKNKNKERMFKKELKTILIKGLKLIEQSVIANVTGKNLSKAHGISIYFPDRYIHKSYLTLPFVHNNAWLSFLNKYLTYK